MKVLPEVLVLAMAAFLVGVESINVGLRPETKRCERITNPMCRNIPYNYTMMPNQFHHETQEEAGLEVHQFWPLVKVNCSPELDMFLCSMYFPLCMENYPKRVPVCRSVCLRTKVACAPIMEQYGFSWPEQLQCEQFPMFGDEEALCMDWKNGSMPDDPPPERRPLPPTLKGDALSSTPFQPETCTCSCPIGQFAKPTDKVAFGGIQGCAESCRSPYPNADEWAVMEWWIGGWSLSCCILTMFALMTFILDRQRFLYPERPIVLIALCYFFVSMGFILRLYLGHDSLACVGNVSRESDASSWMCTLVFVLLYPFGMASCLWWVILSLTWYLAAGRKWSTEAITEYWKYFHLIAWGVPIGFTAVALGTGSVDGDPIAGVCYVGHHDLHALMFYIVAPVCVYLVTGVGFLLLGLVSLRKIHRAIELHTPQDREKRHRFQQQMSRIGTFSLCTLLPFVTLLGCNIYEMLNREEWEKSQICDCKKATRQPYIPVFMIKYLAMLVVGITSSIWFINRKTFRIWSAKCCCQYVAPSSMKSSDFILIKSNDNLSRHFCKSAYSSAVNV